MDMEVLLLVVSADVVMHLVVVGGLLLFWVEVEIAAWVGLWAQLTTVQTGVQVLTSPLKGRPYFPPPVERGEPPCPVDAVRMARGSELGRGCGFRVGCSCSYPRRERSLGEEGQMVEDRFGGLVWGWPQAGDEGLPVQQGGLTSMCYLHLLPWRPLKRQ